MCFPNIRPNRVHLRNHVYMLSWLQIPSTTFPTSTSHVLDLMPSLMEIYIRSCNFWALFSIHPPKHLRGLGRSWYDKAYSHSERLSPPDHKIQNWQPLQEWPSFPETHLQETIHESHRHSHCTHYHRRPPWCRPVCRYQWTQIVDGWSRKARRAA